MKKYFYSTGLTLSFLLLSLPLFAQNYSNDLEYRKWRVTLINPIGSNGANATDYTAKYSINLIGGYHGALNGAEFGALFNAEKYYASGVQLAGITNYSQGYMEGVNITGVINYSSDYMSGIQFAGVANITGDNLEGINIAGALNLSGHNSSGLQFAGIGNASTGTIEGLQFGGLFNAAMDDISGLQSTAGINFARNDVEGLQAAGVANFAGDDISGLQASGGANIALGNIEGLLASGFFNYAGRSASGLMATGGVNVARDLEGLAFAGVANIAKDIQGLMIGTVNYSETALGLEIGVLNIAKEFEGAPIGIVSLYGNGRKNIDIRYSDGGFTDVGFTTGTYRVYNSAIIGYNTNLQRNVYRVGLAVGLEKNITDSFEKVSNSSLFVNQEFSMLHHFEEDWSRRKNWIYSYKFLIGKRFGNYASLYGGPSLNMQVSRVNNSDDYTWYSLWSPTRKGLQYQFWVGFTVGMRLFHQKELPLLKDDYNDWDW